MSGFRTMKEYGNRAVYNIATSTCWHGQETICKAVCETDLLASEDIPTDRPEGVDYSIQFALYNRHMLFR